MESVSILVVDDEPPLRNLMQAYLERLGYKVATCADANCAIGRVAEESDLKLIVADLSLPDMRGNELGLQALKLNPALRILLCSGYPFELDTIPVDKRSKFGTLQKPFLPNMLAAAVQELLGR